MNWSDFEILLMVSKYGTLKKAAEHLGLNQSTVSRRVRALESALGASLLENVGSKLVFTSALKSAELFEQESKSLSLPLEGIDDEMSGTIRLGVLDIFTYFHHEIVDSFLREHPKIVIELVADTRSASIAGREVDVAVRLSNAPGETLVGRRIATLQYAVFSSDTLSRAYKDDWCAMPWLAFAKDMRALVTQEWMKQNDLEKQVVAISNSSRSLLDLLEHGIGACVLPINYARPLQGVVQVSAPLKGFEIDQWVLTHRDLKRSAKISALLGHLSTELSKFFER